MATKNAYLLRQAGPPLGNTVLGFPPVGPREVHQNVLATPPLQALLQVRQVFRRADEAMDWCVRGVGRRKGGRKNGDWAGQLQSTTDSAVDRDPYAVHDTEYLRGVLVRNCGCLQYFSKETKQSDGTTLSLSLFLGCPYCFFVHPASGSPDCLRFT